MPAPPSPDEYVVPPFDSAPTLPEPLVVVIDEAEEEINEEIEEDDDPEK